MISDPKNLTEQLQNLSERIAIEMRALNRTKVSKINGAIPDNNGEVTIANATTSASGLMSASDKTKLSGIAEGANNYSLPTASSSQLGGVKTGSNITNTSGTISVSKKNVTDALGYTPLQTAPVTSVDGKTGAVDLSATYQPKGNYLTSAPVTSVNGKTGAVTVDVGVTSFNGQSGAVSYSAPVTSVNGKTGAVTIDVGGDYTLPTATDKVLGGVKVGSNITNTSGTISLTKSNVTSALGYTPLQNAPVTKVNGQTGDVTVDVGVTSFNGSKGAVTYTAPVTSVNGKTGAVTIDTGVTSFNGKTGAVTYSAPVSSVNGQTGAVSIDVGVKTVNNVAPDASGNVTIEVSGGGGGLGDGIPRTGNRGYLAGYNELNRFLDPTETVVIDGSSSDDTCVISFTNDVNIEFVEGEPNVTWVKQVLLFNQGGTISFTLPESGNVLFDNLSADYVAGMIDVLVYVWYGDIGIIHSKSIM